MVFFLSAAAGRRPEPHSRLRIDAVLLRKRSRPGDADRGGGYPPGPHLYDPVEHTVHLGADLRLHILSLSRPNPACIALNATTWRVPSRPANLCCEPGSERRVRSVSRVRCS